MVRITLSVCVDALFTDSRIGTARPHDGAWKPGGASSLQGVELMICQSMKLLWYVS